MDPPRSEEEACSSGNSVHIAESSDNIEENVLPVVSASVENLSENAGGNALPVDPSNLSQTNEEIMTPPTPVAVTVSQVPVPNSIVPYHESEEESSSTENGKLMSAVFGATARRNNRDDDSERETDPNVSVSVAPQLNELRKLRTKPPTPDIPQPPPLPKPSVYGKAKIVPTQKKVSKPGRPKKPTVEVPVVRPGPFRRRGRPISDPATEIEERQTGGEKRSRLELDKEVAVLTKNAIAARRRKKKSGGSSQTEFTRKRKDLATYDMESGSDDEEGIGSDVDEEHDVKLKDVPCSIVSKMDPRKVFHRKTPPSLRVNDLIMITEEDKLVWKYKGTPDPRWKKELPQWICYGLNDAQQLMYIKHIGFKKYAEDSENLFFKYNTLLVAPGVCRVWSPANLYNKIPSAKGAPPNIFADFNKFKNLLHHKNPNATTEMEWKYIADWHRQKKQIMIVITREYVEPMWLKKTVVSNPFNYAKVIVPIHPDKPFHTGLLVIREDKCVYWDCNNFLRCEHRWPEEYYHMIKNRPIRNILKHLGLTLKRLSMFWIPVVSYSWSVSNSCALYVLYAIEHVTLEQVGNLYKPAVQAYLYFERVANVVGGHVPWNIYIRQYPDWRSKPPTPFIYEELFQEIRNGKTELGFNQLMNKRLIVRMQLPSDHEGRHIVFPPDWSSLSSSSSDTSDSSDEDAITDSSSDESNTSNTNEGKNAHHFENVAVVGKRSRDDNMLLKYSELHEIDMHSKSQHQKVDGNGDANAPIRKKNSEGIKNVLVCIPKLDDETVMLFSDNK